ncbi:MAG: uroporphyrinogen decarboxylase [Vampirovibrionales bacterium]|nr:uroporphyrinogen decarboxylase [Vampirovibrionales bacterium]
MLLRALAREPLARPPVWLMRQAGRYMDEYQAIRSRVDFLTLCKTPELAAEVSLQPLRAFDVDAVIMFCDILIPCEAMGMTLHFGDGGPRFETPVRSAADVARLAIPDPHARMGFVGDLLRLLRHELRQQPQTALIGFAGAPWTLAAYMIEGGGSRHFMHLKQMLYNEPAVLRQLLDKLSETIIAYLGAQIEAGAQAVQLFDTWAGIVDAPTYRAFIQPSVARIVEAIGDKAPVTLYVNGSPHLLEAMAQTGVDCVSVDWLTPLSDARARLGPNLALQGNLDPVALLAGPDVVRGLALELLSEGGARGFIANVGHGLLPQTPRENVRLLVDTIRDSARLLATGASHGV